MVFPRWWRRRALIDAEILSSRELELLALSTFGLMRQAVTGSPDPLGCLRSAIADLDRALAGEAVARRKNLDADVL
jgi:hypothetical protein